jgi:hypothetical protein
MAKIALYFPGNATHSFLLGDRWQRMSDEHLGLDAIGRSGVPVTTSHQGLDYELYPFLAETLAKYPSISVANAPFAHPLLTLVHKDHQKWELRNVVGNLPITFFSEFDTPEAHLIPTKFFFHLRSQTAIYSMPSGLVIEDPDVLHIPDGTVGVRYGANDRIGIVLDGFEAFNKAWFAYGAKPTQENLDKVMNEIEAISQLARPYVVIPIDLEQPWVGSVLGSEMFERFFAALKLRGLDQHIVPMEDVMAAALVNPFPINRPHRILGKWNVHQLQFEHMAEMKMKRPQGDRQHFLYAFATLSDLLSSWNRFVAKEKFLSCRDLDGTEVKLSQGHNKHLQQICLAAKSTLMHGDVSFVSKLRSLEEQNGLTIAVQRWALERNL